MSEIIIASTNKLNVNSLKSECSKLHSTVKIVDSIQKALKLVFDGDNIKMVIIDIPKETQVMQERLITFFNKTEIPCLVLTQNYRLITQFQKKGKNHYLDYALYSSGGDFETSQVQKTFNKSVTTKKLEDRIQRFKKRDGNKTVEALAAFLLFEPVIKTLFFKMYTGDSFINVFNAIIGMKPVYSVFEYFLLFPIGAYAFKSKKIWGLVTFFSLCIFHFVRLFFLDHQIVPYESLGMLIFIVGIILMVGLFIFYSILPEARKDILSRSGSLLRAHERYSYTKRCSIQLENGKVIDLCQFLNISMGGALVKSPEPLYEGEKVFLLFDSQLKIECNIKRLVEVQGEVLGGFEFAFTSIAQKNKVASIVNSLS